MTEMLIPNKPQKGKNIDEILAGMLAEAQQQSQAEPVIDGEITCMPDDEFIFTNIPCMGCGILPGVVLSAKPIANGQIMTMRDMEIWSQRNSEGRCVANSELLYQCLLRAYEKREQPTAQQFAKALWDNEIFVKLWAGHIGTFTKVEYGQGSAALVSHFGKSGEKVSEHVLDIPEFENKDQWWSHFVLANEQPASELGKTNSWPENAMPAMKAALGHGYEKVAAVLQYFVPPINGKLKEMKLVSPPITNRPSERTVAFCDYGLDIARWNYCDDTAMPAFAIKSYTEPGASQ